MSTGPTVIRRTNGNTRSNLELVKTLRENFHTAQEELAAYHPNGNGVAATTNGNGTALTNGHKVPAEQWTEQEGDVLFVPRIDWRGAGLREEASQYEVTLKLFFLPGTPIAEHESYVTEALALVRKELAIERVDLLVASFAGMSFEGTCEWEADKLNAAQGDLDEQIATWRALEKLVASGQVSRLGVAEFGSEKLAAFMERTTVHPSVDQINLQQCCSVPPPLKKIAVDNGIELNVHTDCTDIMPQGTLRELLNGGKLGAGVVADVEGNGPGLKGELLPQWVVRYTAFVRDRGVVENKGYFVGAKVFDN